MRYIELLSPARDADIGIAAVNCGADAVYIGAGKFGARKEAGNPISEIARLTKYAHLFRSKVYLALNTILRDDELEEALLIVNQAWNAGIDGLIIQDMGLLECQIPPIKLIASTQTNNISPEKVLFLEKSGFGRVILARELSLLEIADIRSHTTLELESFVHGALCVSYSGQCWASFAVTGRSANRGECSQICRSSFDLEDSEGRKIIRNKHLLSLKDMNLSSHLKDLIDSGVSSFKIEGRLKDRSYVQNITSYYRHKLDLIMANSNDLKKPSSGKPVLKFEPDPDKTFNRGYTTHFIMGRQLSLSSFLTQKSTGKRIGYVISSKNGILTVNSTETIYNGDGICYFDKNGNICGFLVNNSQENRLTPNTAIDITEGTSLYRNHDLKFLRKMEGNPAERKISVTAVLEEVPDGFRFRLTDEDNFVAEKTLEIKKELAQRTEIAANSMIQQLSKTGDTHFHIRNIEIRCSASYFIPVSLLNSLRRQALRQLLTIRENAYQRIESLNKITYPGLAGQILDYRANIFNSKSVAFYLKQGVKSMEPAYEKTKPFGEHLLMKSRYCLKFELQLCPKNRDSNKISEYHEPYYLRDSVHSYRLEFDCKACEMNLYLND